MKSNIDSSINIRLKEGDHEAFVIVYNYYAKDLYFFVRKYIKDDCVCDDIVHDSFLNLWKAKDRIKETPIVGFYLFKIARNLVFKELKKQINAAQLVEHQALINMNVPSGECLEKKLVDKEYALIYDLAIDSLPPQRKRIFRMSREEGMSYKEIAYILEISNQTVKEHMSLAMRTIRDYIAKEHNILLKMLLIWIFLEKPL